MKSCLFGVVRRCLRIIRLKPLFFLLFLFFSLIQLSISTRYLPEHICQRWVLNWSRALFTFSSFELRVERCSRDRTLPVRYAFIREDENGISLVQCFHVFRVCCFSLFSFFFFKRNCYMRFWESWDGFMVRDSSDWRKCGKRWVEICFREIKMKVWELGNYYYYFKIYLWYLGILRVDFVPWKFAKYTISWCFEFC